MTLSMRGRTAVKVACALLVVTRVLLLLPVIYLCEHRRWWVLGLLLFVDGLQQVRVVRLLRRRFL